MIRFLISASFMILGLLVFTISVFGNFKYAYVLNRMHIASVSDTLGVLFVILSLLVANGFDILSLKLVLILGFLWFTNPVSSHFLSKTEIIQDDDIKEKAEVVNDDYI